MLNSRHKVIGMPMLRVTHPASAFNPLSLSPVLWLDFSDASTLFQDSARTTSVAADGDVIGGVTDKSGSGKHAYQGTVANKPLHKLAIQNGKSAALFDNSNDYLRSDIYSSFSGVDKAFTIFAVFKYLSVVSSMDLYSFGNTASDTPIHAQTTTATPNYRSVRRDDAALLKASNSGTPNTSAHILSNVFTGSAVNEYVDGIQIMASVDLDVGTITFDRFNIGARSTVSGTIQALNGYVFDFIVFSSALSNSNRELVEGYLTSKWGI